MDMTLLSVLALLVTLGVLIAFHEFGHFWVARRLGVKVLRFSIGFGKPLWLRRGRVDNTEYVVAAVPLGGYVRMLDEHEGEVPAAERHRAFNRKSAPVRIAVVAAGPLFNFLFAILAFSVLYVVGVAAIKPLMDAPQPHSIAASAGFKADDLILAVDGQTTPTLESVVLALLERGMDQGRVRIQVRNADGALRVRQLDLHGARLPSDGGRVLQDLGLVPWQPVLAPVIEQVLPNGAAALAGLKAGDRVVAVDGHPVTRWRQWADYVRRHPGQTLSVKIARAGKQLALKLTPASVSTDQGPIGRVGVVARVPRDIENPSRFVLRYNPFEAIYRGVIKTWDMSVFTLKMLGRMVVGRASLKNISGPITIAEYAGQTAAIGWEPFLSFMALVSISLGVLNLLPIPVLDGGHLLYYLIELVRGRPLSEAAQAIGQRIGLAAIVMLMGLALFNDFARLLR